jgi:uncharacterized membrane protein
MPFLHTLTVVSIPTVIAVCLASLVEFIEAFTIVLAVSVVSGWRNAAIGAVAAVIVLGLIVGIAGPILHYVNIKPLQIVAGVALIVFGGRWLKKAVLRAAGRLALHDEAKTFAKEVDVLSGHRPQSAAGFDLAAAGTAFNGVLIEGIEVAFIVIAAGATSRGLAAATLGAAIALVAVALMGIALRRPVTQVPENTLKLVVGIMVCALGVYWFGEGIGVAWPGGVWMSLVLAVVFAAIAAAMVQIVKRGPAPEIGTRA